MIGESFQLPLTGPRPRVEVRSLDARVNEARFSLSDAQISFEDGRRAFVAANRHLVSQRRQERVRIFDPEMPLGIWVLSAGLELGLYSKSDVYDKRIETLRGFAADEEITVNETSVRDFRYFVDSVVPTQNAQLVVMDNGNLRAVWKNDDGSHLGLQFLGAHLVQYVVFRRGGPEGKVYRLAGESSFDEMRKSIEVWGLSSLMSA